MNDQNSIVCSKCNELNPMYCGNTDCPFEDLFWEEDE